MTINKIFLIKMAIIQWILYFNFNINIEKKYRYYGKNNDKG